MLLLCQVLPNRNKNCKFPNFMIMRNDTLDSVHYVASVLMNVFVVVEIFTNDIKQ